MKRIIFFVSGFFVFTGCGNLEQLKWEMTPEKWLATHSHVPLEIGSLNFILAEPSSTILVYGLGFIIAAAGIYFLKIRGSSMSRLLWGIALLFWAASTFSAGTSYQAFSYELKCAGQAECLWTSWWEIWYLILYVININITALAVAYSSAAGKLRKGIIIYSIVNTAIYLAVIISGTIIPDRFMVSFECMVMFVFPVYVLMFIVNIIRYRKTENKLDARLIKAWLFMFAIVFTYFAYLLSGFAEVLWESGIWFNANDVLHLGLILWILYLWFGISKLVEDAE